MIDAATDLQNHIYEHLTSDKDLETFLGKPPRIYDHIDQDPIYPFITISDLQTVDWSTSTEEGEEHLLTLHVWSDYQGRIETRAIISTLRNLLHGNLLDLEDHHLVSIQYRFSDIFYEAGDDLYHGVTRFRILTEPKTK